MLVHYDFIKFFYLSFCLINRICFLSNTSNSAASHKAVLRSQNLYLLNLGAEHVHNIDTFQTATSRQFDHILGKTPAKLFKTFLFPFVKTPEWDQTNGFKNKYDTNVKYPLVLSSPAFLHLKVREHDIIRACTKLAYRNASWQASSFFTDPHLEWVIHKTADSVSNNNTKQFFFNFFIWKQWGTTSPDGKNTFMTKRAKVSSNKVTSKSGALGGSVQSTWLCEKFLPGLLSMHFFISNQPLNI